jgi:hypothetical protein
MTASLGIIALCVSFACAILKMFGPLPWSTYDSLSYTWGIGSIIAIIVGFALLRRRRVASWLCIVGGGLLLAAGIFLPSY